LEVYEHLLREGIVKNDIDFCRVIGIHRVSFAQTKRRVRNFPVHHLKDLADIYYINPKFVLKGKGPMFKDQPVNVTRVFVRDLQAEKTDNKITVTYTIDGQKHRTEYINEQLNP
jgi:hypothetical protein